MTDITSGTFILSFNPPKPKGWCEEQGVAHAWMDGPMLTSNPPIATRQCANCGKRQHLRPGEWEDA